MELPDIDLEERVVLITGGDRGLGLSMAQALARCGARLSLASVDAAGCEQAARDINAFAGPDTAIGLEGDITDLEQCRSLVSQTVDHFGQLDVLFNNARRLMRGPDLPPAGNSLPVWETDPAIFHQTVTVNVIGTFFMTRAAVEHFRTVSAGKIINVSTSRRNFANAHNSPYGVTKAAIESETLIWAGDLEDTGITVNSLLPGGAADADPTRFDRDTKPLLPVDIMDPLAVWLSSPLSDGTTGCRFVGKLWDPALPPTEAANGSREEPVFAEQPEGRFGRSG